MQHSQTERLHCATFPNREYTLCNIPKPREYIVQHSQNRETTLCNIPKPRETLCNIPKPRDYIVTFPNRETTLCKACGGLTMLCSIDDPGVRSTGAVPQYGPTPVDVCQVGLMAPASLHCKAVASIRRPQQLVLDAMHLRTHQHSLSWSVSQSVSDSSHPQQQTADGSKTRQSAANRRSHVAGLQGFTSRITYCQSSETRQQQTTQQNQQKLSHAAEAHPSIPWIVFFFLKAGIVSGKRQHL